MSVNYTVVLGIYYLKKTEEKTFIRMTFEIFTQIYLIFNKYIAPIYGFPIVE